MAYKLKDKMLCDLIEARCAHPHYLLGMHPVVEGEGSGLIVRAFLPDTKTCEVVDCESNPERRYLLKKVDSRGLFEGFMEERKDVFRYRLRQEKENGEIRYFFDPYSFMPTLGEEDLYLINEGTHHKIYEKLGAHIRVLNGIQGVGFAVWAPSAKRVSVVGDFNHWDGRYHPMRSMGSSGIWELFIPGVEVGAKYKYEMINACDALILKTDPYATFFEGPPHNASVIFGMQDYNWRDNVWMENRKEWNCQEQPISIYEFHLGSWRRVIEDGNRPLNYREAAVALVDYLKDMGFTHVELMPLAEHPFSGSWGYQVTGFYAPTHRYGTPEDFMAFVDILHQNGIGVLMDWVPAHFPRDSFALAEFDGTHLYEHADPRQGQHKDWGTLIFNYGRHEVRNFLVGSALAWLDRYHIDGLRVDAVASMLYLDYSRDSGQWVPNQYGGKENIEAIDFIRYTNDLVHEYYPGVMMIAEESTSWGGVSHETAHCGLGFDFKWNMGWMHDTLVYFSKDAIYRKHHHHELTFSMLYHYTEKFILAFSHDEVVHGKGSMMMKMGAGFMRDKAQTLRALYGYMWGFPGKKTLFMGSEWGQSSEWNYDKSLDWHLLQYQDHEGIRQWVRDLNSWYKRFPSLGKCESLSSGFQWIEPNDADNSVLSFLRVGDSVSDTFLVVCHFTPVLRHDFRLGVPHAGFWKEVLNSDASYYGGWGHGNGGGVNTESVECHGRPHSVRLTLPPLSALIFQFQDSSEHFIKDCKF